MDLDLELDVDGLSWILESSCNDSLDAPHRAIACSHLRKWQMKRHRVHDRGGNPTSI